MAAQSSFQENAEIARLFPDLHPPFSSQAAVVEANRCLNCFDAPCTIACPTHIDVPRFIKKISSGNLRGSALGILDANVLASSCARICPVEVLCEGSCVMHQHGQPPIAIGRLQRHAMDAFDAAGASIPKKAAQQRPEKIACLGAGPASLAAAAELKQRGFAVTIFDKKTLPGGLNTYGVAEYKLSTSGSLREIERIIDLGVAFRLGVEFSTEAHFEKLEAEFDMIFVGVGLGAMRRLTIPGGDHPAVVDALTFIENYKLGLTTHLEGCVVVIGAGNTAIDAANAARRLGASNVRILYRRTREYIAAFDFEFEHAKQEGVEFNWLTQPIAIHSEGERLQSIECMTMQIDEQGDVTCAARSNYQIPCDLVIPAIGQSPLVDLLSLRRGLRLKDGRIVVDRVTGQTTHPRYFAGGDCVNGGREVVDAVASGKRSGIAIAKLFEANRAS